MIILNDSLVCRVDIIRLSGVIRTATWLACFLVPFVKSYIEMVHLNGLAFQQKTLFSLVYYRAATLRQT